MTVTSETRLGAAKHVSTPWALRQLSDAGGVGAAGGGDSPAHSRLRGIVAAAREDAAQGAGLRAD